MVDWRSIPCRVVDWYACGVSRRASHKVHRLCLPERVTPNWRTPAGPWAALTLGTLADMGEREWRTTAEYGIGDKAMEVIKATIDLAAEGKSITKPPKAPDAYVPKCERTGQEGESSE